MTNSNKKQSYGFKIFQEGNEFRYVYYVNPPPIRVISFKGGGGRIAVYTKFIEMAHDEGILSTVEEVGGSSSGSLAAAFAAIHYEDPKERSRALAELSDVVKTDVYGQSSAWRFYHAITIPLLVVSKILEWASLGTSWLASQCNRILIGMVLGVPLKMVSLLLGVVSTVINPRFIPGMVNLFTRGGVYRGDLIQMRMRDRYQQDTQAGLDAILSMLDETARHAAMLRLTEIKLGEVVNNRFVVGPNITCNHLYELSKLQGSQFKQYYATVLRVADKSLVILNKESAPDAPIHQIFRLAITFPLYFLVRTYQGEKYVDGGILDNAPVLHARQRNVSRLHAAHGVDDYLTRLNVRVEYPDDYQYHLWGQRPAPGFMNRMMAGLTRFIGKILTRGIDSYAEDDKAVEVMREHFAQRTLQLPDCEIGLMENKLSAEKRQQIGEVIAPLVTQFFTNHRDEKVTIQSYGRLNDKIVDMPAPVRIKLLKYLQNQEIRSAEIYEASGVDVDELDRWRHQEISKLLQHPDVIEYRKEKRNKQGATTAQLMKELRVSGCDDGEHEMFSVLSGETQDDDIHEAETTELSSSSYPAQQVLRK